MVSIRRWARQEQLALPDRAILAYVHNQHVQGEDMLRLALLLLFAGPVMATDPPPIVEVFRGTPEAGGTPTTLTVPVGRFVAFPSAAKDLTYDVSDPSLVDQLSLAAGTPYPGIRFDEPAGAKIKHYKVTDSTGKPAASEMFLATTPGTVRVTVWQNGKGATGGPGKVAEYILNLTGGLPPPGPGPGPGPGPFPPPPPPPPVVSSFRVIYVTESATNLTKTQNAVINSQATVAYLNSKVTKTNNWPDWRSYDPQTGAEKDYPGLSAMWTAAKPAITTVPCVVIQVNGNVTIEPFPASAAEALTLLKKYGGQ